MHTDTKNEPKSENRWLKDAAKSQGLAPASVQGKTPLSATAMKIKSVVEAKEQVEHIPSPALNYITFVI